MAQITFKFEDATVSNTVLTDAVLQGLKQIQGVVGIEQVFPKETDPKLAGLYVMTVVPADAQRIVQKLRVCHNVEFAYIAPRKHC